MIFPMSNNRLVLAIALCAAALMLGGCNENTTLTNEMTQAYQANRFAEARTKATQLAGTSTGRTREQAKYIAGISAYRLGLDDAALADLQPLTYSIDPTIAGSAAATCGIIYYDRVQDALAMQNLEIAKLKVTGEDRARVFYHMGLIEQRAGRWDNARRNMNSALLATRDPAFRRVIEQRMTARSFTLQFGAYSQKKLADQRAATIRRLPGGASVRLVPSMTADGKSLYLIQAGTYRTYDQAAAAKRTMGVSDSIIVPVVEYHQ